MKKFSDFSTKEIEDLAMEASQEARQRALKAGREVAGQDEETGEIFLERLEDGKIVRRPMPADYLDTLKTEK